MRGLTSVSSSADCIANYGNHLESKQGGQPGAETAIYSDVNLSNKLNDIKTFNNSSFCFVSPEDSETYEPIPYATTQLIQAGIQSKAAAAAAAAGSTAALDPLDRTCWQQPPHPPPLPKEVAAHMQYNMMEQSMLNKGGLTPIYHTLFIPNQR